MRHELKMQKREEAEMTGAIEGKLLQPRHELKMQKRVEGDKKTRNRRKTPPNVAWIKNAKMWIWEEEGARSKENSSERGMN
jgi:hypothetical protein